MALELRALLYLLVSRRKDKIECLNDAGVVPLCRRTVTSNGLLMSISPAHARGWCLCSPLFPVRGTLAFLYQSWSRYWRPPEKMLA